MFWFRSNEAYPRQELTSAGMTKNHFHLSVPTIPTNQPFGSTALSCRGAGLRGDLLPWQEPPLLVVLVYVVKVPSRYEHEWCLMAAFSQSRIRNGVFPVVPY